MKRLLLLAAAAGSIWMTGVLLWGTPRAVLITNYLGASMALLVHFRGIAPPRWFVWAFNIWLVLTSAIEWMVVTGISAVLVRFVIRRSRTST